MGIHHISIRVCEERTEKDLIINHFLMFFFAWTSILGINYYFGVCFQFIMKQIKSQ